MGTGVAGGLDSMTFRFRRAGSVHFERAADPRRRALAISAVRRRRASSAGARATAARSRRRYDIDVARVPARLRIRAQPYEPVAGAQVRNSAPSPNNVAKPMQSVNVVRITPADSAGSMRMRRSVSGTMTPTAAAAAD